MSTSIPVLNKNHSLPPLLLPASRPVEGVRVSNEVRRDPFSGGGAESRSSSSSSGNNEVGIGEKRNSGSLEGLANLATTKRAKVDGTAAAAAAAVAAAATACGKSPAVQESQGAKSESFSSFSSSVSGSVSPAHVGVPGPPPSGNGVGVAQWDRFVREEFRGNSGHSGSLTEKNSRHSSSSKITPPPACTTPERASPRSSASGASSSSGKRQRVGPSCDGCRLKKIKCDSQVDILLQDPLVLSQLTHRIHQVVTKDEVSGMTMKANLAAVPEDCVLVKHIDKIVMFKPCTSCNKRRASLDGQQVPLDGKDSIVTGGGCVFSKGFTRADINVFAKICKRIGEKPVQEMTVDDYHEAGF